MNGKRNHGERAAISAEANARHHVSNETGVLNW